MRIVKDQTIMGPCHVVRCLDSVVDSKEGGVKRVVLMIEGTLAAVQLRKLTHWAPWRVNQTWKKLD